MRQETKKSIGQNVAFIFYSFALIVIIVYTDLAGIPLEDVSFTIIVVAFLSLWEVFRQALQYESEGTKKKIRLGLGIAAVLGVIFFVVGVLVWGLG